jgi:peroxiredoxin
VELQGRVKDVRDRGLGIAVISYDSREILEAFTREHGITFPLLSDKGSQTITRYGILNTVVDEALGPNREDPAVKADVQKYISVNTAQPMMRGMAFPGTFIVNRQGRVTARFFEDFYIERNTVSGIVKRVGGRDAQVAGTKISTAQLDVTTYPSDAAVAAGNRFALVLELAPRRGTHLYAPGASGYKVIALTVAPQPFVRVLPLKYPASEIYFFKPLNERVPVYQKPFRLVQEVVLEGQPQAQQAFRGKDSLTITGTLDYQACDDRECFNPTSVPLTWTVALRPLVTQRPKVDR